MSFRASHIDKTRRKNLINNSNLKKGGLGNAFHSITVNGNRSCCCFGVVDLARKWQKKIRSTFRSVWLVFETGNKEISSLIIQLSVESVLQHFWVLFNIYLIISLKANVKPFDRIWWGQHIAEVDVHLTMRGSFTRIEGRIRLLMKRFLWLHFIW